MGTVRLIERHQLGAVGRVDRAAGVLRGAVLCGFESANGRTYQPAAFKDAARLYEGKPIYADHGDERGARRLADKLGWFEGVKNNQRGLPVGDAHLLLSHPLTPMVMEAAERNPKLIGFSHVVEAATQRRGGREVVESIRSVHSIDLVSDPATVSGIWESIRGRGGRTMRRMTVRRFLAEAGLRREQAGDELESPELDTPMPSAVGGPDDLSDTQFRSAVIEAVRTAGNAVWGALCEGRLDFPAAAAKLKKLSAYIDRAEAVASESRRRAGAPVTEDIRRRFGAGTDLVSEIKARMRG